MDEYGLMPGIWRRQGWWKDPVGFVQWIKAGKASIHERIASGDTEVCGAADGDLWAVWHW